MTPKQALREEWKERARTLLNQFITHDSVAHSSDGAVKCEGCSAEVEVMIAFIASLLSSQAEAYLAAIPEDREHPTKRAVDELGRPNLTPTELMERAEDRGFNSALAIVREKFGEVKT